MTPKINEIKKLESELKAHNERASSLRNELKKARKAEIAKLQNDVISAIYSILFLPGKGEKLVERLERFQLLHEIFSDAQILENLKNDASRFLIENGDKALENVTVENAESGDFAVTEFGENSRDFEEKHDTDFRQDGGESE